MLFHLFGDRIWLYAAHNVFVDLVIYFFHLWYLFANDADKSLIVTSIHRINYYQTQMFFSKAILAFNRAAYWKYINKNYIMH